MSKILLTGKSGQIGWELQRTLATLGDVVALGRHEMDLADPDSIRKVIREVRPVLIVNAAAYTAVDKAESEPDVAMAVNGIAPGIMAEEAKRLNAMMVHFSTDYVFDGAKDSPYREEDAPNPLNVYGRTKWAGERAIQAVDAPYLIFRTGWVYGARGRNFLLTMLKLAREGGELKVVDDQFGAPTWSRLIAETTAQILAITGPAILPPALKEREGLYHVAAAGRTSWHGFAELILRRHTPRPVPRLAPIPTHEYPQPARRPAYSCLACKKLESVFGLVMPAWEELFGLCAEEMTQASL